MSENNTTHCTKPIVKKIGGVIYELSKEPVGKRICNDCAAKYQSVCGEIGDDCFSSKFVWRKGSNCTSLPATANFPFDSEGTML